MKQQGPGRLLADWDNCISLTRICLAAQKAKVLANSCLSDAKSVTRPATADSKKKLTLRFTGLSRLRVWHCQDWPKDAQNLRASDNHNGRLCCCTLFNIKTFFFYMLVDHRGACPIRPQVPESWRYKHRRRSLSFCQLLQVSLPRQSMAVQWNTWKIKQTNKDSKSSNVKCQTSNQICNNRTDCVKL